ncbi:hypothetical protein BKA62DRAFT_719212 [Auriculariales sp. MPI-PUGE-AT-0066]|nr:hypothetical protein BKA62DRAFT_719212 [Auriculariales sp. MPI-PUGE-AT-0066]
MKVACSALLITLVGEGRAPSPLFPVACLVRSATAPRRASSGSRFSKYVILAHREATGAVRLLSLPSSSSRLPSCPRATLGWPI